MEVMNPQVKVVVAQLKMIFLPKEVIVPTQKIIFSPRMLCSFQRCGVSLISRSLSKQQKVSLSIHAEFLSKEDLYYLQGILIPSDDLQFTMES